MMLIQIVRKVHSVASANREGQIFIRELACYCLECIKENFKNCLNKDYVGNLELVHFTKNTLKLYWLQAKNQI
jgi:hypothetical protein